MKMLPHIVMLLFSIPLLSSCGRDLPLPEGGVSKKIVLLGELVAGDSVLIRGAETIPIKSGPSLSPSPVSGLTLTLETEAGTLIPLQEGFDYLSYYNLTLPFSNSYVVNAGGRYTMTGVHPQMKEVTANISIPEPFTTVMLEKRPDRMNSDSVLGVKLQISDANIGDAFYVLEVMRQVADIQAYFTWEGNDYRLEDHRRLYDSLKNEGVPLTERSDTIPAGDFQYVSVYTDDLRSENLSGVSSPRGFKRIFFRGKEINTGHITELGIPLRLLREATYDVTKVIILVKSVAPDYYDFLKRAEQFNPSGSSLTGINYVPVQEGNVKNGLGMVGGVYRQQFSFHY
jgi:hypothetical protein